MPPIRRAIGGFTARSSDIQLSADVAQNLLPEYAERESDLAPRPRVAMVSTPGFKRFDDLPDAAVTAMAGTRERFERLAVAAGRTIRLYEDPNDSSRRTMLKLDGADDATSQTIVPVLGAVRHALGDYYYACLDGIIRRRASSDGAVTPATPDNLEAVTPRGMAIFGNRIWFSCVEDRRIRALTRMTNGDLARTDSDRERDLVPSDEQTAIVQPESLFFDAAVTSGATVTLAVLDAAHGDVHLFDFSTTPDAEEGYWRYVSQSLARNTLSLQLAAGDGNTRRPVQPGGVHLDANTIRIVNRGGEPTKHLYSLNRSTGAVIGSPVNVRHAVVAGGFVGGETARRLYLDGRQAAVLDPPVAGGIVFDPMSGAQEQDGLEDAAPDVAEAPRGQLVPLDETGRYVAWQVERQVHLLDLAEDRLIPRIACGVDSIAAEAGVLVGADATRGVLRVSPPQLVVTSEPFRRGVIDAAGQVVVPGWPRDNPSPARWVYVGARSVLAVTADRNLWVYADRSDIEAEPTRLSSPGAVSAICAAGGEGAAGQCVIVFRGDRSEEAVEVRWFAVMPQSNDDIANLGLAPSINSRSLGGGLRFDDIADVAFESISVTDGYLYVLFDEGGGAGIRSSVFSRSGNGQYIAALSTIHTPATWGAPSGYERVVAIDFSDGVLRAAITGPAGQPTVVRAIRRVGETRYERVPSKDINANLNTRPYSLNHDAKYLYECDGEGAEYFLEDGEPTLAVSVAAFWNTSPLVYSKYRWNRAQELIDGSETVANLRGALVAWTPASVRIYQPDAQAEGFPFQLLATRDIGIAGPLAFAQVRESLCWFDRSGHLWMIPAEGDTTPQEVVSPAAEEALAVVDRDGFIRDGVAMAVDSGGHPSFVCGWRNPGLTLGYDLHTREWHTRTSLRLGPLPSPPPFEWQDAHQAASRVEYAATWRGRRFYGGFGVRTTEAVGIVAEEDLKDWYDIDGGAVQRVRQFGGRSLNAERRIVKYPVIRVDATYGHDLREMPDTTPSFSLLISNDGGRRFGQPRGRKIEPSRRAPRPFYGLGYGRFRVYRIECSSPVPFSLLGCYADPPSQMTVGKF